MKVKITQIVGQVDKTSKSTGKPYTITTAVADVNGETKVVETLSKVEVGQEYEGDVTFDTTYNKWSFKKANSGGYSGGGGGRGKSPEEIESIELQSARRDAVDVVNNYYMQSDEKAPQSLEEYTKKVVRTAIYLRKAIKGQAPADPDPVRAVQEVMPGAVEVPADTVPTDEEVENFKPEEAFKDL